jgi:hypothetical protein
MPTEITDATVDSSVTKTPESDSVISDDQNVDSEIVESTDPVDITETESYDSRKYEESLGFPAGSLKNCKTEEAALIEIRKLTDAALSAGLGVGTAEESDGPVETTPVDAAPKQAPKPTTIEGLQAEIVKLNSRLDIRDSREAEAHKIASKRAAALIEHRLEAEVDAWASPVFGVKGSRTYAQTRELTKFKDITYDFINGLQTDKGKPVPTIEAVARSCWAYVDPKAFASHVNHKSSKKEDQTPLGTPGSSTSPADKDSPTNIHSAVFRNGRFVSASSLK